MSDQVPADDEAAEDAPRRARRVMVRRGHDWPPRDPEYAEVAADTADHWDERIWFPTS